MIQYSVIFVLTEFLFLSYKTPEEDGVNVNETSASVAEGRGDWQVGPARHHERVTAAADNWIRAGRASVRVCASVNA